MQTDKLILRCFAEKRGDQWQAFCLDLNLAVQSDSLEEVREKLHAQIFDYVEDALIGEDQEFADQLLSRKAPLSIRARYHFYRLKDRVSRAKNGIYKLFEEVLPVKPVMA